MDASDLRLFEAVARLGGMSRAAAELHTVQSNVTARVRRLEQTLGVALFRRHSGGVSLTEAGTRLLPYARRISELLREAASVARDNGLPRGALVIGALETTAALRLSPLLARFATTYPDVDLSLRTGTTAELVADVLARRVQGAFVCGPVAHPELQAEPIFQEELVLITAPAVAGIQALQAEAEVRILVLRAGCSYRQRLEEILARRGIVPTRRLEFGTIEALIGCTAAGLGVTLLPRGLAPSGRVAGHTLSAEEALVETVFVRRRDAERSSALDAFLDHLRAAICK